MTLFIFNHRISKEQIATEAVSIAEDCDCLYQGTWEDLEKTYQLNESHVGGIVRTTLKIRHEEPVLDEEGNPTFEEYQAQVFDEDGNPVIGSDGDYVYEPRMRQVFNVWDELIPSLIFDSALQTEAREKKQKEETERTARATNPTIAEQKRLAIAEYFEDKAEEFGLPLIAFYEQLSLEVRAALQQALDVAQKKGRAINFDYVAYKVQTSPKFPGFTDEQFEGFKADLIGIIYNHENTMV